MQDYTREFNQNQSYIDQTCKEIQNWWSQPRWSQTKRVYSAKDIAERRGTFPTQDYASNVMSKKLFKLLSEHHSNNSVSQTFGALDVVQMTQMCKYLDTIYVSGWQCSSTASTSNEPGPDLADYPMDTVPNKVDQLFKAQQFHDRKQWESRFQCQSPKELRELGPPIDYLRPIIADADAGHGGLTAVYKLTKMFIERGAAGIHMEDQTSTNKKCGHMAGRCVIPVQEHINRLATIRMCADVMNSDLIIVARTDSEAGTLISSTIDKRDHYFIVGATNPDLEVSLVETLDTAIMNGVNGKAVSNLEKKWCQDAKLKLYHEAFYDEVNENCSQFDSRTKERIIKEFNAIVGPFTETSIREMQDICQELIGHKIYFNWDLPRGREGLYRYRGGTQCAIMRARAFAPYADLVWMESNYPDYPQAVQFAEGVKELYPEKWLAYNLSPSFNWDKAMNEDEQYTFIKRLAKLGYNWQFITLAGLHTNALAIDKFSSKFAREGMRTYAQDVQKMEMENNVDILKHQKWSGAEYIDGILRLSQNGVTSTAAMSEGVTEDQFRSKL